ncbi:Eco57I restriction-modification methylase domain-containing protein [Capnocytophaga cynodegmi]|uniref:Eco57I restriction-modification methylase domain-containing protein n=1 Tax=Capnocytophaga cynodegmi TaxID=28189 RepID=UPI000379BB45|nr:DNA methyltransferase [Capnocytophaga cynodegmi]CEN36721.1 putative type II endonuclease-methyltransferase fusion protein [Capnocytophaga cynodegmi]
MALFQKTVLVKYTNQINKELLSEKWELYKAHFHNPQIQENIYNSKEEQYQEGFLRDLFVNILGYTLNPADNFNLTTEYKNIKDSKKADGAIIINQKVRAIIELKGTNTTDLSKIEAQAFGYKNNQPDCTYVITSNFEKLRFYIDNAVDFLEFNLFNLSENDFKNLFLCLAFQNISQDIPKKIKQESVSQEEAITKKLYKDYSAFKQTLFVSLCQLNPDIDQLILFKKSQKLLDRFLFLFFAEDSYLLPSNSVRTILNQWDKLKELDAYIPLYERFKQFFGYLNNGNKEKEIFAYNGGLFKPDEILEQLQIDDNLLYQNTKKLSEYDFNSEIDVNILGHIFENSLNELDEIQAQIQGQTIDKAQTKRKKDGVFYTPKYITKYIVENTIGKLCDQKKQEIQLNDEDFAKSKPKKTKEQLLTKLKTYREWLLQLTIIDPACGSGAFLNEALNFLIAEHQYLDELEGKLFGASITFQNVENSILENNLFGVDLNEESVEIAKLSLWLRTAQRGRKLNDLSANIKCGNSLISDPEVAGEKAFDWQKAFPKVFEKGGFDVVIGNPPYLNLTKNNTEEKFLNYYTLSFNSIKKANSKNIFTLFNELSIYIASNKGLVSFIIPEGFLKTRSYEDCVSIMNKKGQITKAIYFEDWVFEDATTGSIIFEYINNKEKKIQFREFLFRKNHSIIEINNTDNPIVSKYEKLNFPNLSEIAVLFKGMAVKDRSDNIFVKKQNHEDIFLLGNCIDRYLIKNRFYTNYNNLIISGGTKSREKYDISPRILIRRTGNILCCTFIENPVLTESTLYSCYPKKENNFGYYDIYYILGILNSKLLTYIVQQKMITNEQAFPQILMADLQLLKIPNIIIDEQLEFSEKIRKMLSLHKELREVSDKFSRMVVRKFELGDNLPKKLQTWHELSFKEFVKELGKLKIKLSLSQEAEWEDYFLQEQKKAQQIATQITQTDKEIDQMVYKLYNLTEEEIKIVES